MIVKWVNLAIYWEARFLHLKIDSLCLYQWLANTLSDKTRVSTKTASKMLLRRWLQTFLEYTLVVDVMLIKSNQNKVDRITSVPLKWLVIRKKGRVFAVDMCQWQH